MKVAPATPTHRPTRWRASASNADPGQLVALVGPSGACKTTISYLIPRLYDVTGGSVQIDCSDVRHVRQASLAAVIGFVTQESYLFHDSILANIRYGRPAASMAEVEEAAAGRVRTQRERHHPQGRHHRALHPPVSKGPCRNPALDLPAGGCIPEAWDLPGHGLERNVPEA